MMFLFFQGNHLLEERRPVLEAIGKVKLYTTSAHLSFEEISGGDKSESIDGVWSNLTLADWYCLALLYGGKNEAGDFLPVQDESARANIREIRELLQTFKSETTVRYNNLRRTRPGSKADNESDKTFRQLILLANEVETLERNRFNAGTVRYRYTWIFLMSFSTFMALCASYFLYRKEKDKTRLVTSLNLAKYSIEEKNKELKKRAHYDALTGLPNRVLFVDRLEQVILHAMRSDLSAAVLFIDLDRFKSINDSYGHHKGDLLLQTVANRICQCIRESDTAARISGDEFMVVLSNLSSVTQAMKAANKVAKELIESLAESYQLGEVTADISASIGVALYPNDSTNCDELIRYADSAMYYAKTLGKNNFQFYSRELHQQSMKQMEIERDLKDAVRYDQFELHFQPIWNLDNHKIKGVEVLTRWAHPSYGLIYPDEFIPIAENCGLIQRLDAMVTRKALKQLKEWQEKGLSVGTIGINISSACFRRCNFFTDIRKVIVQSDVDPLLIELELKESLLVEHDNFAHQLFADLKGLGVRIALDGFGTGYSSMSYLKDFRFDTLKIDHHFIADYTRNEASAIVLKNILTLGQELGLDVVAEGIETETQVNNLKAMGCHTGQGYLLSRPLDKDALEQLLNHKTGNVVTFDRA
ncbi:putative bifunctional diguanylate cyclase/phosphodiesterase [Vibrio albus]|nr:EAL domain-containing protein [Vibrio albus]